MIRRGDIYYVQRRDTIGTEIAKSRPGIIVSTEALNNTSGVVEVVYLTTSPKKDMPNHVKISTTGTEATALCEQIHCEPVTLLGTFIGVCTPEEMKAVDAALLATLGINAPGAKKTKVHDPVNSPSYYTDGNIETIDFIEDKKLGYHLGSAVAYISRAGKKDPEKKVEDLQKAVWYINRVIENEGKNG